MASFKEFVWQPDLGAALTSQSLATPVKFGDGYESRVTDSLHVVVRSWNVSFTRTVDEILPIHDFLFEQQGRFPFRWTDPLDRKGVYVCRTWSGPVQVDRGLYQVTCTFEEVFES